MKRRNVIYKGIEDIREAGEEQKTNRRIKESRKAGEEQNRQNHNVTEDEEHRLRIRKRDIITKDME